MLPFCIFSPTSRNIGVSKGFFLNLGFSCICCFLHWFSYISFTCGLPRGVGRVASDDLEFLEVTGNWFRFFFLLFFVFVFSACIRKASSIFKSVQRAKIGDFKTGFCQANCVLLLGSGLGFVFGFACCCCCLCKWEKVNKNCV